MDDESSEERREERGELYNSMIRMGKKEYHVLDPLNRRELASEVHVPHGRLHSRSALNRTASNRLDNHHRTNVLKERKVTTEQMQILGRKRRRMRRRE